MVEDAKWDVVEEASELLRDGELDAAKAALEAVLEADERNEYAYFFLGTVHFERGAFDKATKAFLKALEIAPEYLGAMNSLGHSLRLMGRHTDALRVGRQILARAPDDGDGLYLMGLTHYARGERAAAERYLRRFLESRPELEVANEVQGLLEVLSGNVVREDEPN